MKRSTAVILFVLFAGLGCARRADIPPSSTPLSQATKGGDDTKAGSPAEATTSSATSKQTFPDSIPGIKRAALDVQLSAPCLKPGLLQTITIKAPKGLQLAWGTLYPDGQGHNEWGGQEVTTVPESGTYSHTWPIPIGAAEGDARTDVAVAGKVEGEDAVAFSHPVWQIRNSC